MWLLPWEKLPPLILGPLMIVLGVFAFLVPDATGHAARLDSLWWGIGVVAGGVLVTVYGVVKQRSE